MDRSTENDRSIGSRTEARGGGGPTVRSARQRAREPLRAGLGDPVLAARHVLQRDTTTSSALLLLLPNVAVTKAAVRDGERAAPAPPAAAAAAAAAPRCTWSRHREGIVVARAAPAQPPELGREPRVRRFFDRNDNFRVGKRRDRSVCSAMSL